MSAVLRSCVLFLVAACLLFPAVADASACRGNSWQPTYVHDLISGDGIPYYVMPDGRFVQLTGDWANQSGPGMCCLYGVRDRTGFTDCFAYTRVQCGCDEQSVSNDTCRAFLAFIGQTPVGGPPGYAGCYRENRNAESTGLGGRQLGADMIGDDPGMTIRKCIGYCRDRGHRFAGLQYGRWCFCGSNPGERFADNGPCNMSCSGNQQEICGGAWANSVYGTSRQ